MKKIITLLFPTLLFTVIILLSAALPASAAADEEYAAAQRLYELGLFTGRKFDADGNPDFALDSPATREEAAVMLMRLENRRRAGTYTGENCPFTDVSSWARGYLEYAAESGLVMGRKPGFFDAESNVTAAEYLTMVLRALGYHSEATDFHEKDFDWDRSWLLSDRIGLTNGEYGENTVSFTRGDMARISARALDCNMKGCEGFTLSDKICEDGLRGTGIKKELNSVLYSDGESVRTSPRLRMLSAEYMDSERLYVFMDDLYLLLAAATDVLDAQADGSVAAEYTQHPSDRNYTDYAWVRDYGSFGMEHFTQELCMSFDRRNVVYSLPYDETHSHRRDPGDYLPEFNEWDGTSIKFTEEPGAMGNISNAMSSGGSVSCLLYGEYNYINDDNPNLCGFHFGYPVFVSADDFLAYFGFDCTLKLTDSAGGLVWSLAQNTAGK